jgi:diaminohydroxyphosphoribosylaminopyrimidine deaminase/5-amino-6-(5-phosphoribosylamino)uracil reductase
MRQGDRDKSFMSIALDLARLGLGRTSPNPAVGAVIVKGGRIVGKGFHRGPGQAHAEIEALASIRRGGVTPPLHGTTLYVTLEPCCPPKPGGRTPPCTEAILKSGIKNIVIGMKDPDPSVSGRGIALLRKKGLRVQVGVLEEECRALNEAYVIHRLKKRPFVILKMATTMDGKVGLKNRPYKITGPEADRQVHALRDRADAILVGIGTVLSDDPRLTTRLKGQKGRDPIRVVLDGRLRISPQARLLNLKSSAPTWIATGVSKKHPKARKLAKKGAGILFLRRDRAGRVDLPSLLRELGRRGVVNLLVEGGPQVWSSFLKKRLVDRLALFIAPKRLGARGVPALFQTPKSPGFAVSSVRQVGRDLMMEGRAQLDAFKEPIPYNESTLDALKRVIFNPDTGSADT